MHRVLKKSLAVITMSVRQEYLVLLTTRAHQTFVLMPLLLPNISAIQHPLPFVCNQVKLVHNNIIITIIMVYDYLRIITTDMHVLSLSYE